MSELFCTPLNAWHHEHGAKMAPFAGWDMPIQYEGILAEHEQTRKNAALFDICHMGEFLLSGEGAQAALAKAVTHNLATLKVGKCRYGFLLNEKGGILDDLIVYCMGEDSYMLVVNGACIDSDFAAIKSRIPAELVFSNVSDGMGKLDLQGPKSIDILENFLGQSFRTLGYFSFMPVTHNGVEIIVSRTGYTGELGYELYMPSSAVVAAWETLLQDERVKPAGLGARDTLRLESGLPLYGQDLDTEHTPTEAGYGMMLKSPVDYVGKGADASVREVLVPLVFPNRRSARHNDLVFIGEQEVGRITSASFAPSLGYAIAFAYIKKDFANAEIFQVKIARGELEAKKAQAPFYTEGTARIAL